MGYYIDLQRITMDQYKAILKSADLLPSRKILQNNIDENFTLIKAQNIANVDELRKALKNKRKVEEFSRKSRLSADYLKILIREVNSYRQPPIKLRDFPGVSANVILKLENLGITNTLQLFDHILTPQSRQALSERAGVDQHDLLTLAKLTDLGRIRWVNHGEFVGFCPKSGLEWALAGTFRLKSPLPIKSLRPVSVYK